MGERDAIAQVRETFKCMPHPRTFPLNYSPPNLYLHSHGSNCNIDVRLKDKRTVSWKGEIMHRTQNEIIAFVRGNTVDNTYNIPPLILRLFKDFSYVVAGGYPYVPNGEKQARAVAFAMSSDGKGNGAAHEILYDRDPINRWSNHAPVYKYRGSRFVTMCEGAVHAHPLRTSGETALFHPQKLFNYLDDMSEISHKPEGYYSCTLPNGATLFVSSLWGPARTAENDIYGETRQLKLALDDAMQLEIGNRSNGTYAELFTQLTKNVDTVAISSTISRRLRGTK